MAPQEVILPIFNIHSQADKPSAPRKMATNTEIDLAPNQNKVCPKFIPLPPMPSSQLPFFIKYPNSAANVHQHD